MSIARGERIADRFIIEAMIGRGSTAEVYRVADARESGHVKALKILRRGARRSDRENEDAFREEFALFIQLRHPHIATVFDWGYDAKRRRAFFTGEHLEGGNLESAGAPRSADELATLFMQCAVALDYLHNNGVVHKDVKPSNIIVTRRHEGFHARIVDFGFVSAGQAAGTPGYIAPEILRGDSYTPQSDLYALGMTFSYCLDRLISSDNAMSSSLSARLRETISVLTAADPKRRHATAGELSWDLSRIFRRPCAPFYLSAPVMPRGRMVGREDERRKIVTALREAEGGEHRRLTGFLLTGPEGIGKTRLAREVAAVARTSSFFVVEIDAGTGVTKMSDPVEEIERRIADTVGADTVGGGERGAISPAERGDRHRHVRVRDLMRRIGKSSPVFFVVEDIHALSLSAKERLAQLVQTLSDKRGGSLPFLWLATSRLEHDALIFSRIGGAHLPMTPLVDGDIKEMFRRTAGGFDDRDTEAFDDLIGRCGGVPAVLEGMVLLLSREGILDFRQGVWRLDRKRLRAFDPPDGIRDILRRLLKDASDDEVAALQFFAVAHDRIPLEWLNHPTAAWMAAVVPPLIARGYLAINERRHVDVTNPRMRETILAAMTASRARECHRRAFEIISASRTPDTPGNAAAVHAVEGRLPEGIRRYAGHAGRRALEAFSFTEAEYFLDALLHCLKKTDDEYREVALKLGGIYLIQRNLPRAEILLRSVVERAATDEECASACLKLAGIEASRRRPAATEAWLDRARKASVTIGGGRLAVEIRIGSAHLLYSLRRCDEGTKLCREILAELDISDIPDLRAKTLLLMALILIERCDYSEAERCVEQALEISRRQAHTLATTYATNVMAAISLYSGRFVAAGELAARAADLCRRYGYQEMWATALNIQGLSLSTRGKLDDAIRMYDAARDLCEQDDVEHTLGLVHENIADFLTLRARYRPAIDLYKQILRSSIRRRDVRRRIEIHLRITICLRLMGDTVKSRGHLDAAEALVDGTTSASTRVGLRSAKAVALMDEGDGVGAVRESTKAVELARMGSPVAVLLDAQTIHARALAGVGDAEGVGRILDEIERRREIPVEIAVWCTRLRGEMEMLSKPPRLAKAEHALRNALEIATSLQDSRSQMEIAFRLFQITIGEGDIVRAGNDLATARVALSSVTSYLPEESRGAFLAGPIPHRILQSGKSSGAGTHLRSLLKIVEKIRASGMDAGRALDVILGIVLEATRSERGFVIAFEGGNTIRMLSSRNIDLEEVRSPEMKISATILRTVRESGKPILLSLCRGDPRLRDAASIRRLQVRSALCAPIFTDGRVVGALYLDNRFVPDIYDREDLVAIEGFAHEIEGLFRRRPSDRRKGGEGAFVHYGTIVGVSEPMREVFQVLEKAIANDLPVLIEGESGTGKELIAKAIHSYGSRRNLPFVAENCAAISPSLLPAELFGHTKGAFTGAEKERKGLFEQADHGTLFLDEIANMGMEMQKSILRVLQNGEIRRIGGNEVTRVDVRVIAASNQDTVRLVREGKFREDLFYRLNVLRIVLPPLRQRTEDVPILTDHFCRRYAERTQTRVKTFSAKAVALMTAYAWPGNVRQMENEVTRILTLNGKASVITPDMLSMEIRQSETDRRHILAEGESLETIMGRYEREVILDVLGKTQWNVRRAAKLLGIQRATLYLKMRRYDIART